MPPKVYLQSPPNGDFRAMPALGDGVAMLKWISSFPRQPGDGPADGDGNRAAVRRRDVGAAGDPRRALRHGAADRRGGRGRGAGAGRARCARAPGSSAPGCTARGRRAAWRPPATRAASASTRGPTSPRRSPAELGAGWRAGTREEALACDVVTCVTPGHEPVVSEDDLRPGMHLNMLGADGPGKAEATIDAVVACELYCDEWAQAAHGGELTGAVEAGRVSRAGRDRSRSRAAGEAGSRSTDDAMTLFDSTGPGDPGPGDRDGRADRRPRGTRRRALREPLDDGRAATAGCCRACASAGRRAWSAACASALMTFGRVSCGTITSSM